VTCGPAADTLGGVTERLPVFPLGTVLFPGLVLPLHIFEERYRTLVRELVARPEADGQEFGVVAIRRGWEVEQLDPEASPPADATPAPAAVPELYEVGCTAELRQVTELKDGRFDIVTVGRRRFQVVAMDTETAPYLMAEVRWLPEEDPDDSARILAQRVLLAFRGYLDLLRPDSDVLNRVPDEPTVLSHLVAASVHLTVDDRQALLAMPDTTDRLRAELRLLKREVALLRQIRAVPAPLSELARPTSRN